MVMLPELVQAHQEAIVTAAQRHGARSISLFGSAARGDADDESDLDFLVEMEPGRTLLDLGGLVMELRALLGRSVDVVTLPGLRTRIRERVLQEAVRL